MEENPNVISLNVNDNVKSGEGFGEAKKIFQNPTNDPKILGMTKVRNLASYQKLGSIAFMASKEAKKPIIIVVEGHLDG